MHNEDYIASGKLELYAAGGLTEAEREEVERRAAASPEIRMALDEACAAMEAYAGLHAVSPRPALKNRIMQQLAVEEAPARTLYQEAVREPKAYRWMLAASLALAIISGILSFYFYNRWQQAEDRLAGVMASEQLLARNFHQTNLQLQQQEETLSILRNPDFQAVRLQGVESHPEARMTVYWNQRQQQVYVDQVALPAPPTGKQYQLWALADGKPIDAGMLEMIDGKAGLQQMKNIGAAQAFAVTLEPAGGSASPTLDELRVMGNVSS
ncbi:anti-sigma factor [uncultured Pontibacter sp.]|uniref:anti-sigma factor n=1 Tax=uncultured Pontibacter sp. TaxID=453356 RepID=UPI002601F473|nr:anti-sigma factor [uncultured Pontibacter sp.]